MSVQRLAPAILARVTGLVRGRVKYVHSADMVQNDAGKYVEFADYLAVKAERDRLRAELDTLRASGVRKMSDHCNDCCCARSWTALGVTEFTGKSIPEHIAELTLARDQLRAERDQLRAELDTMRAAASAREVKVR